MSRVKIKIEGLDELLATMDKIEVNMVKNTLNYQRAHAYKELTISRTESDALGLDTISEATIKLSEVGAHTPMAQTGELLNKMAVRVYKDGSAGAGYWAGGPRNEKGITFTEQAILHHLETGYRIPLTGDKGARVRVWLAARGITPGADKEFLHVKPRPFMYKALDIFQSSNEDDLIIKQFMESMFN